MNRIWAIAEQHVNDEASGFGFTFASHPSEDGMEDKVVSLTIYNTGRDKKIILMFDRNGQKVSSTVEANDVEGEAVEASAGASTLPSGTAEPAVWPKEVVFDDPLPEADPVPEAHHWPGPGPVAVGPGGDTLAAGSAP